MTVMFPNSSMTLQRTTTGQRLGGKAARMKCQAALLALCGACVLLVRFKYLSIA